MGQFALPRRQAVERPRVRRGLGSEVRRTRNAYLFIAPFYALFLVFSAFPIIFAAFLSFQSWDGFGPRTFIGLRNYRRLAHDELFRIALKNTVVIWLGHMFIMLALALVLALLLDRVKTGKGPLRAAFYIPNVVGTVPMALAFSLIFDTDHGFLNGVLHYIGVPAIGWTTSIAWSKVSIILFLLWRSTGWFMVIFLAALQSIDRALYEAAMVDGASAWRRLWAITLPGLQRFLLFAFIIATISSFRLYTEPTILTRGGPANSSLTVTQYLYLSAFTFLKLGYGAAISYALFALVLVFSLGQFAFWRRGIEEE